MTPRHLATGALFLALAGCGTQPATTITQAAGPSGTASVRPSPSASPTQEPRLSGPPPVTLDSGTRTLDVQPYTTCWTGEGASFCADGMPAHPLPDLGPVGPTVAVSFPVSGWRLQASCRPLTGPGPSTRLPLRPTGEGTWTMVVRAPAGPCEVSLSGRGPEGDIAVAFRFTSTRSPSTGPMPR